MSFPLPDPGLLLAFGLFVVLGVFGLAADRYGCDSRPLDAPKHHN